MRNRKRIISLVMTFLYIIPFFTVTASADGVTVLSTESHSFFQNSDGVPFTIPFYRLSGGNTAYGINVGSFGPVGDDYIEFDPELIHSDKVVRGLQVILLNAEPLSFRQNDNYQELSPAEKEYAAAVAIWAWILSGGTSSCHTVLRTLNLMAGVPQEVYDLANDHLAGAVNSIDADFFVRAWPDVVRLDTSSYDPDILEATFYVELVGASEYFIDYSKIPGDITVEGYTGADNNIITLTAPASYRGVSLNLEKVLYADTLLFPADIIWLTPSVGGAGAQKVAALEIGLTEGRVYGDIEFRGMRGSVVIEKVDEDDVIITNSAAFVIRKTDNTEMRFNGSYGYYEHESNNYGPYMYTNNGRITISGLPEGDYLLYETTAPSGYTLKDTPTPFTVTYGSTQTIRFENKQINGSVTIKKIDEDTREPLAGAVFNVYYSNGTIFDVLYTDQDGIAVSKPITAKGKYTVKEFFAPQGYLLNTTERSFTVTDSNTVFNLEISNKKAPHGRVSILKLDKDVNTMPLGGAVFGVFRESDNRQMAELTTNAYGIATSQDLVLGSYIVRELMPPYGYKPNETEYPVELTSADPTVTITVENEKLPVKTGNVSVLKLDADDGIPLEDVEFSVYRAADYMLMGQMTTDENGEAELDGIPIGQPMFLSETRPRQGYALPTEPTLFILETEGQILHYEIENTKQQPGTGSVAITKAEAGNPTSRLAGAVFDIISDDTGSVIATITSELTGRAVYDGLPHGDYHIKEKTAPEGFKKSDAAIPFTLSLVNSAVFFEIENERDNTVAQGRVKLIKTDDMGTPLSGAVFGIYAQNKGTEPITLIVSGPDGTAVSGMLPIGNYYMQEIMPPTGYKLSPDKYHFSITKDSVIEVRVENEREDVKPKGTLEVYFKHIRYDTELHRSYSYTDDIGTAYMQWVNKNNLDKKNIPPYFFIKADYPSSMTLIDGKLVIVYWYDDTASGGAGLITASVGGSGSGSGNSGAGAGSGMIRAIPKTGLAFPWGVYTGAAVLVLCGTGTLAYVLIYRRRRSLRYR